MACLSAVLALACPGPATVAQERPTTPEEQEASAIDSPIQDDVDDLGLLELEIPMVVTAARHEQKITQVPHAVSVITAEDIRLSGARSVPDALRLVPGVDVAELAFAGSAVSPRGFHGYISDQLLVLVDGRQIFDSLFGGTAWGSWPFQMEDIARIEVVRGPGGVTWGANAVAGVINIITKDPADQAGMTLTLTGGSRGTQKEHLGYAFADQRLRLRLSFEHESGDGFNEGGALLVPLDDRCGSGRLGLHGIFDAGPHDTLTFSAGAGVTHDAFPPALIAGLDPHDAVSQAEFITVKWLHEIAEENHVEVTGYLNDFYLKTPMPSIEYRYQQLALQLRHTFSPANAHELTWGIDSRTDLFDGTNADPDVLSKGRAATTIIGLYGQDEWRLTPKWTLNLGGRIDYESYGGFQPSGRLALSYRPTDNSLFYGAVSRAFQMPAVGARLINIPLLEGLSGLRGHRDVDVQQLIAYELGYHARLSDRLKASLDLFWHEYRDLTTLSLELGPPGLVCMDYNNRASASVYGLELEATYAVTEKLTLLGNYTFETLDWRSSVPYLDHETMTPPKHKAMVGARYHPTDDLHLSAHCYYVGAVEGPNPTIPILPLRIDPYVRLDLRAEQEFWNDRASFAVGVRNLLDPNHLEGTSRLANEAEVPRMFYAEFRLTIK